jgi:hypothetical protein
MGNCTYCGESAGWFKTSHGSCAQANSAAKTAIVDTIARWLPEHPDVTDFQPLLEELTRVARAGHIDEEAVLAASRHGLYAVLDKYQRELSTGGSPVDRTAPRGVQPPP